MAKDSIVDNNIIALSVEEIFIGLQHLLVALSTEKSCLYFNRIFTRRFLKKLAYRKPRATTL
jgi:hypothetical protein